MNNMKQLVFRYFDMVLKGYKKHGRRPTFMRPPHVLLEYMNDSRVAFEYDTEEQNIRFDYDDFYTAKNMLGVSIPDLSDFCREYVADKFGDPDILKRPLLIRNLNI